MVRVFAHGPEDRGSIPGRVIQKTQNYYLMPSCLTLSIIRCRSTISGAIQGKELRLLLYLGVVAIKKGAFGSSPTTLGQLIYIV